MKKCKFCRKEIDINATICPYCRKKQKKNHLGTLLAILIFLIVIIAILLAIPDTKDDDSSGSRDSISTSRDNDSSRSGAESAKLPHEIKSFSYTVEDGYLFYAACFYNPNEDYYIQLPKCRVTARDENGGVLGTKEIGLMGIYPKMETWDGGLLFSVEKEPATVDFEVIEPEDYYYREKSLSKFPDYKEMKVINTNIVEDGLGKKLIGEVQNDNDFSVDCAALTIVFLDGSGNPIAAERTFVDDIPANSTAPFEKSFYIDFITDNYVVYADLWF